MRRNQITLLRLMGLSVLILVGGHHPMSQAETGPHTATTAAQSPRSVINPIEFRQPDTNEANDPQDRPQGGGSRTPCPPDEPTCTEDQMTALVPQFKDHDPDRGRSSAWGQTAEAHPTLWFYIPYSPKSIHQAVFELWDSDDNVIAQQVLTLQGTPGVISHRPTLDADLEVGKTYRWDLLVRLDPENPSGDAYVSGRIKRVALSSDVEQQLQTHDLLQRARVLAAAGIWYDTLAVLTDLYPQQPQYWQTLLQDVGLEHLAKAPLTPN